MPDRRKESSFRKKKVSGSLKFERVGYFLSYKMKVKV